MKNEHALRELSAYLDGECKDSERVARHLQQCPECARRYMELAKVSSHLRAMQGPEVHPAFCTRVMAEIAEVRQAPKRSRWTRVWAPVVVTAVLLVAAWTAHLYLTSGKPEGTPNSSTFAGLDDSRILAEIERRVAQGEDVKLASPLIPEPDETLVITRLSELPSGDDVVSDAMGAEAELLEAIATSDWAGSIPVAVNGDLDLSQSIETLDEAQQTVLKELLIQYALEDVAS